MISACRTKDYITGLLSSGHTRSNSNRSLQITCNPLLQRPQNNFLQMIELLWSEISKHQICKIELLEDYLKEFFCLLHIRIVVKMNVYFSFACAFSSIREVEINLIINV